MESLQFRPMLASDWPRVKEIYEIGIATGIATFEQSAPAWEKWDGSHLQAGRLVAVEGGQVIGWIALTPVSSRCVYGGVAEVSIYIDPAAQKKGVGLQLMRRAIEEAEKNGLWTLQSEIISDNAASIRLHEKAGFRMIGYREKIARQHGLWKNNVLMERRSQVVGVN